MDPRRAYMELVTLDKQLRELLRANPLNAHDANALRRRLMDAATRLVDANPVFGASKEVEQALWKPCFYRRIEDFRRRIRKYAAAAQADRNVREHFARVSNEFQAFLTEAAAFYAHLRDVFAQWLLKNRDSAKDGGETMKNIARCRQSLHRCFVFLGDLARYRELHSQKAKKNFAAAEALYHRALAVLPENGNPHNQLAVLATYIDAETVAVYRYCRSLLTAQPFVTAEENLALLFERSRQRPLAPPVTFTSSSSPTSKEKSAFLKSYLHRLTRMHGILFALSSPRGSPTAGRSNASVAAAPVYPRDMEAVLFKDMRSLLHAGVVGDALLLKVVVTNIFCIIRASTSSSSSAPVEDALRLALRTITSVVEFVTENLDSKTKASQGANGKSAKDPTLAALRLLGPVAVFCEYLEMHPDTVEQLEKLLTRRNKQFPGSSSDATVVDQEGNDQFALGFLQAVAAFVNHSRIRELYAPLVTTTDLQHGEDIPSAVREKQHLLKESFELVGFAPLEHDDAPKKSHDDWALQTSQGGSSGVTPLSDTESAKIRAWKVYHFARYLCDGYEGDPLLFRGATGQFTIAPQQTNATSEAFASLNLGFLESNSKQLQPPQLQPQKNSNNDQHSSVGFAADEDDDFDDEVIVFQPSPALTGMSGGQPIKQHGGFMASAPSPLDTLSNGGAFSLRAPSPISPPEDQRRLSIISQSSAFGGADNGTIGSSIGYPSFHTFSDTGSFSGQGLLSGWGNSATSTNSNTNNNMPGSITGLSLGLGFPGGNASAFMMPTTSGLNSAQSVGIDSNRIGATPNFAGMTDLAAIEPSLIMGAAASKTSTVSTRAPRIIRTNISLEQLIALSQGAPTGPVSATAVETSTARVDSQGNAVELMEMQSQLLQDAQQLEDFDRVKFLEESTRAFEATASSHRPRSQTPVRLPTDRTNAAVSSGVGGADEEEVRGRLTTRDLRTLLRLHYEKPQSWTTQVLAEKYGLQVDVMQSILNSVGPPNVLPPRGTSEHPFGVWFDAPGMMQSEPQEQLRQ
ncbi:hypothetical protein PHYBOEH_010700 [Phytophthora boehmeriae]|uniref:Protein SMG7 n=1 Tax=Phytophthora boehmeriae TaxID=109152 RepID=A0A8T1WZE0_9STRA|nr:hypothetical protein PHYBOEH_010700 [Phytophthora boehmeriae]